MLLLGGMSGYKAHQRLKPFWLQPLDRSAKRLRHPKTGYEGEPLEACGKASVSPVVDSFHQENTVEHRVPL